MQYMSLDLASRAQLDRLIDNTISLMPLFINTIHRDNNFEIMNVNDKGDYVLGLIMGKIISSFSSIFFAIHNRIIAPEEISELMGVVITRVEDIRNAYASIGIK